MVVNELNTATNLFKGDISYDGGKRNGRTSAQYTSKSIEALSRS